MARSCFDFASCLLACSGLALGSCGRTPLRDSPGATSGGAGGASASSATGGGAGGAGAGGAGTGGAGGASACDALTLSGPPIIDFVVALGHEERRPILVTEDGGARAAVVFALEPIESPGVPFPVGHTAFAPWGDWPSTIGQGHYAASIGGRRFAATGGDGGFALLLPVGGGPNPGVYFAPSVAPETDYSPIPDAFVVTSETMSRPAFVARGASGHVAGSLHEAGGFLQLEINFITPEGDLFGAPLASGCATTPMVAGAVPSGDGYLVAFSSGRPFGTCFNDDGIPGPPTELQVAWIDANGAIKPGAMLPGIEPIFGAQIVARSDGAWLVWQQDGSTSEAPPPIVAVRLDAGGQLASDIFEVVPTGVSSARPFAADRLGDKLVVTWVDAIDPSAPNLIVQVFDEAGLPAAVTSLSTAPGFFFDDQLAVMGSPAGNQALLAYASNVEDGPRRIHVARFDCLIGE